MRIPRPWLPASSSFLALILLSSAPVAPGATITVNTTADTQANDGQCTLREAIVAAKNDVASGAAAGECAAGEASPTVDTIAFNIPGSDSGCDGSGVCTIAPASALPSVGDYVTFDGYTQSGASVNTLAAGTNAVLKIVLSGAGVGLSANCLYLPASHDTIRGLVINGCPTGIYEFGGGNHKVLGCFIGVNAAGAAAVANDVGMILSGTAAATIGGTDAADRNLISGNDGPAIQALLVSDLVLQGNLIGTNAAGTAAIPNSSSIGGVRIDGSNTLVGGSAPGAGNVISGNLSDGIRISGTGVTIQGNLIGTDASGTGPLGNSSGGIVITGAGTGAVTVGGTGTGEANVIAFNGDALGFSGVTVFNATGVAIRGNSIHSNENLGIDLGGNGQTPNDSGDSDAGPNNLQNFPVLLNAFSNGSTTIAGTMNSAASTDYKIDFFSNVSCDSSGFGEGQTYLGSKTVTTDGSGNIAFSATFPVSVSPQARLTATATDPNGNTSEFCSCLSLQAKYHTITPCRVADTRTTSPPALAAGANRPFTIGGQCGIPANAQAVAFNFTITQPTAVGDLRITTGGGTLPLVSTMNYRAGQTRANNAIVPLGPSGDIVVHVDQASGSVQFVVDVNGYFQ